MSTLEPVRTTLCMCHEFVHKHSTPEAPSLMGAIEQAIQTIDWPSLTDPSESASSTVLRFWQDAREEGTEQAWMDFFNQMDALAHYLMHDQANSADRLYFLAMRDAALDMIDVLQAQRTSFQQWLRNHKHVIGEAVAEQMLRVIANVEDDAEQGYQINKALYARFLESLAKGPSKPEPDTGRIREARAINAENRRAHG